jgi:predicted RecB family nuclease
MAGQHLTKSRYMAGLQCLRRLWLLVHEPPPYDEPAPGSPMDVGYEIGRKAHLLFPGGILVTEEPWQHEAAVLRTAALMADPSVPAVFEAAFEHDGIRVRVDVIERLGDGWGLREVKSSTRMKNHHVEDLALQAFVLAGAGVPVSSIELVHVNNTYIRAHAGICWQDFFSRTDAHGAVAANLEPLPERLPAMRDCLAMPAPPRVETGGHCGSPYGCEFWDQCTADKPADWINYLPRLSAARCDELKALGIEAISAIPGDFPLTWKQVIIRDAIVTGRPYVAPDLGRLLHGFQPPACYLDFEAMMPPVPLYAGTRPYQTIPFQWSLHAIHGDGTLHHREFLAAGDNDPRLSFVETLIVALAEFTGPILVYSGYEQTRLRELAGQFPDLRPAIDQIIGRLLDLLPIVRGGVYLPAFSFSNSIKSVAPALAPGFGYADLDGVADGMAASAAFAQLASGTISDTGQVLQLRTALLAYCKRDTLAMVEVHRALIGLVSEIQATHEPSVTKSDALMTADGVPSSEPTLGIQLPAPRQTR